MEEKAKNNLLEIKRQNPVEYIRSKIKDFPRSTAEGRVHCYGNNFVSLFLYLRDPEGIYKRGIQTKTQTYNIDPGFFQKVMEENKNLLKELEEPLELYEKVYEVMTNDMLPIITSGTQEQRDALKELKFQEVENYVYEQLNPLLIKAEQALSAKYPDFNISILKG